MGSCRQRRRPLRTSGSGLQLHNNVIRIRHFISMDYSLYGYGYEEGGCPVPSCDISGLESFASSLLEPTHSFILLTLKDPVAILSPAIVQQKRPSFPLFAFTLYNCLYFFFIFLWIPFFRDLNAMAFMRLQRAVVWLSFLSCIKLHFLSIS